MTTLTQPIHATGGMMTITLQAELYRHRSAWQEIAVYDTPDFGRMLVIDGFVQATEFDHALYDAALIQSMPSDGTPTVLVLGGGDGFVTQAVLTRNSAACLQVVDIDAEVVETAKKWFAQTVFADARVSLHLGDARNYLSTVPSSTVDAVLIDLTDNPPCSAFDPKAWRTFYEKLFADASRVLVPGGHVAVQAGAATAVAGTHDSALALRRIAVNAFSEVTEHAVFIPSFGEACVFLSAWNPSR